MGTNGLDTSTYSGNVIHVMKAGFEGHDWYTFGTYSPDRENFLPQNGLRLLGSNLDLRYDYGNFYASKSFFDDSKNRRVLWGWIPESDSQEDDIEKGWAGLQSFPRAVWIDRSGTQVEEEEEEATFSLTSSRHLADKKVGRFDKSITRRKAFSLTISIQVTYVITAMTMATYGEESQGLTIICRLSWPSRFFGIDLCDALILLAIMLWSNVICHGEEAKCKGSTYFNVGLKMVEKGLE
ncbi:hypothetical protein L6452_20984 [Arctium lappa]|uniref:Uncharacterized protein n=1 Tax=Arctium lappa TaxID=4217 RepID=A0ACB9BC12_ARCLA|nr:hypothetical protein L6452_20984 [Arctium lappa]